MHFRQEAVSSFHIPDPIKHLNTRLFKPDFSLQFVFAICLTIINVILISIELLLGGNKEIGLKWGIIFQVGIIWSSIFDLGQQTILALGNKSDHKAILKLFDLGMGGSKTFKWSLTTCIMVVSILLIFEQPVKNDWIHNPWTWTLSNLLFITCTYLGLKTIGHVLILHVRYNFEKYSAPTKIDNLMKDIICIELLLSYARISEGGEDQKSFHKYKKYLFGWVSVDSKILRDIRYMALVTHITEIDLEIATRRVWDTFEKESNLRLAINLRDFCNELLTPFHPFEAFDHLDNIDHLKDLIKKLTSDSKIQINHRNEQERIFENFKNCLDIVWMVLTLFGIFPLLKLAPDQIFGPVGLSFTPFFVATTVILGQSISNIVNSFLFILINHPFDVGDDIRINGQFYSVKKIDLLHCTLTNFAGIVTCFPYCSLSQLEVENLTRTEGLVASRMIVTVPSVNRKLTIHEIIKCVAEVSQTLKVIAIDLGSFREMTILMMERFDMKEYNLGRINVIKQETIKAIISKLQANDIRSHSSRIETIKL